MAKTHIAPICLSLYISLSLLSVISAFSPLDHYLVNCGSSAAESLDPDHRTFTGDAPRFSTSTRTIQILSAVSQLRSSSPLYNTARAFKGPARYAFPIRDRGTHHLVRLHFHPLFNNEIDLHEAEFHVLANGFLLLHNFRIPKTGDFPIIKEFIIPVDSEKLDIAFMPSQSPAFGFVNAIEVISAPKDMIADVAQFVGWGKNEKANGLLRNGFETVHRVNVGGLKVTPFNDSLWRTWFTDDEYFNLSNSSEKIEKIHFGGRIKYQNGGASREVGPDNVYNTARAIKSLDNAIPSLNITWMFQVEKGYSYMVRMHFCDIVSATTDMLYFNVYVNGNLAYENLDLSEITGRLLASPFYADFVVSEASSGILEVSVGPSNMSLPRAADAILNGVEIWKMNNSKGSFDGEVCAEFIRKSWRRQNIGVLIPLVAFAVFLMLTASMFMQRRRDSSVGWSRLPVDVSGANLKCGNQLYSMKV